MPFSPFSLTATSHPTDISNDSNNIRSNSNNNALPHGTANDNNINAGSTINGDDDDGGSGPKGNTAAHSHFAAHSQFGPPPVVTHSRSAIAAATAVSGAAAAATGGSGSSTSGAPAGTAGAHSHDSRAAQPQHPLTSSAFAAYKQPNFSSAGGLSALSSGYLPVQAQKQSQVQSHSQLPVIGASQSQSPTTSTSVHNNSISNLTMSASTSSSITQANSTVSGFAVGKSSARNSLSHSTFNMNNNNTSMSNANNASARASANANTAAALAVTAASASVTATNKSALRALALPVLGLYFAYTLFALLQESLFLQPGFEYRYAFALTSVQYALYVILSAVRLWWHGRDADSNHSAAHSHSYDRKGDGGQNAYQYSSLSTTGADDGVSAANVSGLSANNTPRHNTSRMNDAGANDSAISLESISINTQANPMFDDNGYKNEAEGDDSSTDSATTDYDSHRNIFNNSSNDNNHDEHKTSGNVSRNHCYESQSGSRSRSRSQSRSHSHSRSRLFLLSPTAVTPLPTGGASPAVLAPLLHPYSSSLNLSTSPTHGHSPSSGDKNASTSAENDDNSPSSESDSDSITPAAWRFYLIGGLTFVSSALSNVGCHNLPYPLQVMLKSCKVLPTVVIGSLFFGSKYRRLELAAIGLLTAGAALAALDAIFSASSAKLAKHALPIASSPTGPDMGSTVGTMGTGSTGDNIINDTGSAVADAVSATVAMAIDSARAFYRQQRVDSASAAAAAATAAAGAAGVFKTTAVAAAEAAVEAVVSSSGNGVTVSSVTATAGLFAGLAAWLAANGVHLPTLIGVGAMLAALSTDAVVNNSLERLLAKHQVRITKTRPLSFI